MLSFYPVLLTDDVERLARFYRETFEFEFTFESDWYVSLRRDAGAHAWELAILRYDHPTVPEGHAERSRGIIVNVEVADATAEYERIVRRGGTAAVRELRDEEFGQRHFIITDPAGNLVDVIENIAPSAEYAEAYTNGER